MLRLLVYSLLLTPVLSIAELHPFTVHDILAIDRISDMHVSADGSYIVFTLKSTDLEANIVRTDLWMIDSDGKNLRQVTRDQAADSNPRWGPDGAILFLSERSGSSQVWSIDPHGGKAIQVTDLPLDIGGMEYSDKLQSFLLSIEVYPGMTIEETVLRDKELDSCTGSGMIYDELMFRHWDTWEDGKRKHIFISQLPTMGGKTWDLMPKLDADTPTSPWGSMDEITLTPDGRELLFTAKVLPGSEPAWSTDYNIFSVLTDGTGEWTQITQNKAWDTNPLFSPDGKTLCYRAMERPTFEADRYHFVLRNWKTGAERTLDLIYNGLDLSPSTHSWAPDGKSLICSANYLGQHSIFSVRIKDGKVRLLVRDGYNKNLTIGNKRLYYTHESFAGPAEIHSVKYNSKSHEVVTHINDETMANCLTGDAEQMTFKGWNDETVYAYVVKPYDWTQKKVDAGEKWPVAFLIHGGPQGSAGNGFGNRWNPQTFIGAGFAAIMIDFHGSTGYGQDFCDAISHHWGDRPLEDLEKGLAGALNKYRWMDSKNIVAAGASYGGYMINWIHGQEFSNKFKAFVNHDGIFSVSNFYYETEELWFPEYDNNGKPWETGSYYNTHNPVDYIQNWHVPTLVVHGGLDYRISDTQGMSTFTALRRRGVPAKLLYFPDENHWVLKPQNSVQWHDEVLAWLQKWTD